MDEMIRMISTALVGVIMLVVGIATGFAGAMYCVARSIKKTESKDTVYKGNGNDTKTDGGLKRRPTIDKVMAHGKVCPECGGRIETEEKRGSWSYECEVCDQMGLGFSSKQELFKSIRQAR